MGEVLLYNEFDGRYERHNTLYVRWTITIWENADMEPLSPLHTATATAGEPVNMMADFGSGPYAWQ